MVKPGRQVVASRGETIKQRPDVSVSGSARDDAQWTPGWQQNANWPERLSVRGLDGVEVTEVTARMRQRERRWGLGQHRGPLCLVLPNKASRVVSRLVLLGLGQRRSSQ